MDSTPLVLGCTSGGILRRSGTEDVISTPGHADSEQVSQLVADKGPRSLESIMELLLMSMALLDFEMMAPTGPDSWIPHGRGALYLLNLAGPHACQKSPFFEIFWHLRFCMAYVTLITRKKCYLSHDQWIQVPFLRRGKTSFDKLIDSILVDDPLMQDGPAEDQQIIPGLPANPGALQSPPQSEADHPDQISDYQRIYGIIANLRDLVSKSRDDSYTEERMALAASVMTDSEYFIEQRPPRFNVALQVSSAMNLVAHYSPCPIQKARAARKVSEWHGRFVLRSPCG
ncbi:hypothetical protein PT974_03913 [Cladobotryum mycophilum]|uniref:Uncharacterized protein n=1 Tax=Cladobotryum mycophilum TaxID=491253 RepID=A0ABR0SUT0_9HYPO